MEANWWAIVVLIACKLDLVSCPSICCMRRSVLRQRSPDFGMNSIDFSHFSIDFRYL